MDSAYVQVDALIKEAQQQNEHTLELALMNRKCHYFYNKRDINNLLTISKDLRVKAKQYGLSAYEASALLYLAESYSLNELPDKSLETLKEAEKIIEQAKDTTAKAFFIKSNILISQSNIYYDRKEYEKGIVKLKQVVKTGSYLKKQWQQDHFQFVNYSNIANMFLHVNIDSAEYYVKKSIALQNDEISEMNITGANYYILGQIAKNKKDTISALKYYLKSNQILDETGDVLNRPDLYKSLLNIYTAQKKTDSAKIFEQKLKEYELADLETKNKSLKKIITESSEKKNTNSAKSSSRRYIWIFVVIACLIPVITLIIYKKQKKELTNFSSDLQQKKLTEKYDSLLEMIKKDDPSFLTHFEEIFPDFRKVLLDIHPELTISEIEFCALLKLNLSTKKIAELKFIETRTVQNKKHRIRKKLNIPKNIDIYNWFETI